MTDIVNMKVINLFGQPSAGKSTTAAGLFHLMKLKGFNCELVTEYAKDMVWKDLPAHSFEDQLYITAKQNSRLHRLKGKVDYVITDSPLLLGEVYIPENYFKTYLPLLKELFNDYDNMNFFIKRVKGYNPIGRNQTEEESDAIGCGIKELLDTNSLKYVEIDGDSSAPYKILDIIEWTGD